MSMIGLGGVEFGPDEDDEPDSARIANVIEMAAYHGINWIDTSENYYDTRNEAVIGAALADVKADVMVATKVAPGTAGSRRLVRVGRHAVLSAAAHPGTR